MCTRADVCDRVGTTLPRMLHAPHVRLREELGSLNDGVGPYGLGAMHEVPSLFLAVGARPMRLVIVQKIVQEIVHTTCVHLRMWQSGSPGKAWWFGKQHHDETVAFGFHFFQNPTS
jgi:hypothetical protein